MIDMAAIQDWAEKCNLASRKADPEFYKDRRSNIRGDAVKAHEAWLERYGEGKGEMKRIPIFNTGLPQDEFKNKIHLICQKLNLFRHSVGGYYYITMFKLARWEYTMEWEDQNRRLT